ILAIVYVIVTADYPHVMLLDEPQSFLHPGAARKLIDVLARYPQHQYIVATHSSAIISACDPRADPPPKTQPNVTGNVGHKGAPRPVNRGLDALWRLN